MARAGRWPSAPPPAWGVLVVVLVLAVARDAPRGAPPRSEVLHAVDVPRLVRAAWGHPGTRLGFFTHFGAQFSGTVFALLWGVPYLVTAQGLSAGQASVLLTVLVLVLAAGGYTASAFRLAWLVQYPVWAFALSEC